MILGSASDQVAEVIVEMSLRRKKICLEREVTQNPADAVTVLTYTHISE